MINVNCVTLENNNNYMVIQEKKYNDVTYLYLVNENDSNDFCIRKVIVEDGIKKLAILDNDEEFYLIIKLFNK